MVTICKERHIYICEGNNTIYVVCPCHLLVINGFYVVYKWITFNICQKLLWFISETKIFWGEICRALWRLDYEIMIVMCWSLRGRSPCNFYYLRYKFLNNNIFKMNSNYFVHWHICIRRANPPQLRTIFLRFSYWTFCALPAFPLPRGILDPPLR